MRFASTDVQSNLTEKGKNVDQLRVRVLAFRDFKADGTAALQESPFYTLPAERAEFSDFVNGLIAEGGGDAPESGLDAVALAINSAWTTVGDRRRQVIVVWTDQPAQSLDAAALPADLSSRVPADFSALTDLWKNEQGPMGSSSKRLILFAPDGLLAVYIGVDAPGPTIWFGFNLGKVPDQGEDADPIVRDGPDLGLIGVFDGMGGAGGTVYDTPDGPRGGAYLASRTARDVVERRMLELLEPDWNLMERPPLKTCAGRSSTS